MSPRPLDHLVMPTESLGVARARLTALGFTVAPDGVHPFGTANCCVYFQDGTFLEPLAITDSAAVQAAISSKNMFVTRDRLFRETVRCEGLSAAVFATDDAERDHARFVDLGISAGPILEFRRPVVDSSGASDEAIFRLAFAAAPQSTASYFFTCQRMRQPKVDLGGLQRHPNGVVRPDHVLWNAADITSAMPFWRDLLEGRPAGTIRTKLWFRLPKISFWIATDDVLEGKYEVEADGIGGDVRARSLQFECGSMARLREILDAGDVEYYEKGFRLFVPPAPGQGVLFTFLGNET